MYSTIEPYLAAVGLSAVGFGGIFLAVFGAMKVFGDKWVNSKFNERLEAFKHGQQREIETLKFGFSAAMDRASKLHQREFETLPDAWSTLIDGFNSVLAFTAAFQSYPDINRMSDAELDEFFLDNEFSKSSEIEIKSSDNRNKALQKAIFWLRHGKAADKLREHHALILKQGIFMSADIKARFVAIGDLSWDALSEHRIKYELEEYGERPQRDALERVGNRLLNELETIIRDRLWSDVRAA